MMAGFRSIFLILFSVLVLPGCTIKARQTFRDHEAQPVWTALVAVARTPDYNSPDYTQRWIVRENNVWVDDENSRIEIFRRLERDLYRPGAKPLHEERTWKLQIVLEKRDPPRVLFTARQIAVPSHVFDEADRFFNEVWQVLGGRPGDKPPDESVSPATQPSPIDELELPQMPDQEPQERHHPDS